MLLRSSRSSDPTDRDAVLASAGALGRRPGQPDGGSDRRREVGRSGRPVRLERGFGATVEELLGAAEYATNDVRGLPGLDGRRLVCAISWTETPCRSFEA